MLVWGGGAAPLLPLEMGKEVVDEAEAALDHDAGLRRHDVLEGWEAPLVGHPPTAAYKDALLVPSTAEHGRELKISSKRVEEGFLEGEGA